MSNSKRVLVVAVLVVGGMVATQAAALADAPDVVGPQIDTPWLCPAVGDGVANAAANNNDNGVSLINDGNRIGTGDYSFLPGHNQAGAQVNPNGVNPQGPGAGSLGPGGGNSDWSPIWPPNPPE